MCEQHSVCVCVCGEHAWLCFCGYVTACACGSWMSDMQLTMYSFVYIFSVCVCMYDCIMYVGYFCLRLERHSATQMTGLTPFCSKLPSLYVRSPQLYVTTYWVFIGFIGDCFYRLLNYFGRIKTAACAVLLKHCWTTLWFKIGVGMEAIPMLLHPLPTMQLTAPKAMQVCLLFVTVASCFEGGIQKWRKITLKKNLVNLIRQK